MQSNLIRIKQSSVLKNGIIPDESLPLGIRGPNHLITSGSDPLTDAASGGNVWLQATTILKHTVEPPIQ